jgi:hypothetical protein
MKNVTDEWNCLENAKWICLDEKLKIKLLRWKIKNKKCKEWMKLFGWRMKNVKNEWNCFGWIKNEIFWMKRNKSWTLVPTEECATKCDWQMSFCLSGTFEVRKKSETKRKKKWKERKIDRDWTKIQTNSFYIGKEKKEIKLSSRLKQTRNCNQILRNKAVPT